VNWYILSQIYALIISDWNGEKIVQSVNRAKNISKISGTIFGEHCVVLSF